MNQSFSFTLNKPKLWWPRNLGTPYLYTFTVNIVDSNGMLFDTKTVRYGIRTVEWI